MSDQKLLLGNGRGAGSAVCTGGCRHARTVHKTGGDGVVYSVTKFTKPGGEGHRISPAHTLGGGGVMDNMVEFTMIINKGLIYDAHIAACESGADVGHGAVCACDADIVHDAGGAGGAGGTCSTRGAVDEYDAVGAVNEVGADGAHGANGAHGADGVHGTDDVQGAHGADGANDVHGADGANDVHGADGADGAIVAGRGAEGASGTGDIKVPTARHLQGGGLNKARCVDIMAVITTDQLQCVNFSAGGDMDSESGVTTCMKQNGNICRVGGGVFNGAGAADNSDAGYWASSISSGTFVQNAVWQPQGGIISDKKDASPKKSWTLGNTHNKHHAGGRVASVESTPSS